jgi:hypothetical protein
MSQSENPNMPRLFFSRNFGTKVPIALLPEDCRRRLPDYCINDHIEITDLPEDMRRRLRDECYITLDSLKKRI